MRSYTEVQMSLVGKSRFNLTTPETRKVLTASYSQHSSVCKWKLPIFSPRALVSPSPVKKKMTRMDQIITVPALNLRFGFKLLVVLLVKRLVEFKVTELPKWPPHIQGNYQRNLQKDDRLSVHFSTSVFLVYKITHDNVGMINFKLMRIMMATISVL